MAMMADSFGVRWTNVSPVINDATKDTCVHLQYTKWFNLEKKTGRKAGLCHILALLRWHRTQEEAKEAGDGMD